MLVKNQLEILSRLNHINFDYPPSTGQSLITLMSFWISAFIGLSGGDGRAGGKVGFKCCATWKFGTYVYAENRKFMRQRHKTFVG